jgi:formylmethanofuran dehydrogenase subunit E
MSLTMCFVCSFNVAKKRIPPSDERPSYADCDRCRKPTCRGHGKPASGDRFLCILCLENEKS